MKRLIRIMFFLILVSFILIPNTFAQDNIEGAKMVKFNAIYDALSVAYQHDIKRDRDGNILERFNMLVLVLFLKNLNQNQVDARSRFHL